MAWEDRNGNRYYYRKRRQGKQVVSEYVGSGFVGIIVEGFDLEDRQEVEYKRHEMRKQKQQAASIDAQVGGAEKMTRAITWACLLLAGYHMHKGEWRKSRE